MSRPGSELTYESYLRLPELLSLQTPRSHPAAHDELQFIIVHQAYELWFRLLIYEVRAIITYLQTGNIQGAVWLLRRLIEIERVMTQQLQILETMSPTRFLEFRDLLKPASGFQSVQFRELEFLSGLRDEHFLAIFAKDEGAYQRLRAVLDEPNLWSAFCDLLGSRGFDVTDAERQMETVAQIYTDPQYLDLHQLCEAMMEYDEQFRAWRARHALMAERMIGTKPGTGAMHTSQLTGQASFQEPGVRYLQSRLGSRFFPILWAVRTRLGGGSYGG